ncbi:ATP synthase I chain [Melghirimyces thermohalophilus]|uniref:ATP synthase I chain n=1 Tax=Melghirimyces thermohalophilus TaxID=1236220 RepID=A0A1G6MD42_9BACL|nr:ATP synthase subunit I [Melghirimyces thermohalophilus]SDC52865.1 ATP synthase I chain [Melghirimyces thermohalophilus]
MNAQPYKESLQNRRRRIRFFTLSALVCILLLWLVTPAKPFFAGMFLGGLTSLYNVLHLARRLRLVGESILSGGKARWGLGMSQRFLALILPLILGVRFPDQVDVLGIFLGFPLGYLAAVVAELSCVKSR